MESFKTLFVILAIAASASATASIALSSPLQISQQDHRGVVDGVGRCGGYGTPIQLRISGCEGYCYFTPGTVYNVEYDLMPSSAATSLSLACDLVYAGTPLRLFEIKIDNSSVQPGFIYTVKFSIVPNDILAGQIVKLRNILFHTDNRLLEICAEVECFINEIS